MHLQDVTEASNWRDGQPENGVTNLIFASNLPLCFLFGASLVPLFTLEIRGSTRLNRGSIEALKRKQRGKIIFVPGFGESRHKFWRTPSHFGESGAGWY
jgi:hypothetical protein